VSAAPITYWFDFVSPYAWVAFGPSRALAEKHGQSFVARPVLFAGLLDAHGLVGPAEVPAKRAYIFKDAFRKAHARGLPPLVLPPTHPFNPLVPLRAVLARPGAIDLVEALFAAAWIEGRAIDTPEAVSAVASAIGIDGAALVAEAASAEVKARLRADTEAAATRGIFGVPTLELDGELFWGSEAIDHADAFLRGDDPLPDDPRYFERPSSATRATRAARK
jgi:2-hydroxychromene-2-carboxylate isomerase